MSDEIDEIRRELEEVRRLKEQLKREIRELERERPTRHRRTIPTHHPKHVKVDLTGLTEGLDEMLEMAIRSLGGEAIILDRFQSKKILRKFGYPV